MINYAVCVQICNIKTVNQVHKTQLIQQNAIEKQNTGESKYSKLFCLFYRQIQLHSIIMKFISKT